MKKHWKKLNIDAQRFKKTARAVVPSLIIIVGLVGLLWFILKPTEAPVKTIGQEQAPSEQPTSPAEEPLPLIDESQQPEAESKDLYLGRDLQAQFLQVADLYEQNAKYPVTSIPVVGERFAQPVKPFEQAEVDSVYPKDENDTEDPLRLAASVEKMQYFSGDEIVARLIVRGGGVDSLSQINAVGTIVTMPQGQDTGISALFEPVGGDDLEFRATIDTRTVSPGKISREALLKITVTVDGDPPLVNTVPFFYDEQTSALLEGVQKTRQQGAFLQIPLAFAVYQTGYYFVDAFLDDAATGQPLLQLQGEGDMQQGNDVLTLNAHIAALKDAGSAGPYRLRVVNTFLAGLPGESNDLPATISNPFGYEIDGFPFSQYEDTPYVDPEVQERIDFLREIGGGTTENAAEETETQLPQK